MWTRPGRGILRTMVNDVAVYVHIPFCRRRCSYCDFNTWVGLESMAPQYLAAMQREAEWLASWSRAHSPWRVKTLYFGGGTPSLLSPAQVKLLVALLRADDEAEVSLEANPGTVDPAGLADLRRSGINRLSLGMQSAVPAELALLGRVHDFPAVVDAIRWARAAGFDNLSLDLIYGLPGQSLFDWRRSLDAALGLEPEHLSLYALTVEDGTPLAGWIESGRVEEPDPDLAANMYEWACDRLAAAGFVRYEISNWALPGRECHHNLAYWRNEAYLGVGAGAWGHWPAGPESWRLCNAPHPRDYVARVAAVPEQLDYPKSPANVEAEHVRRPLAMAESMFMGLRLVQEGVSRPAFAARFGSDPVEHYRDVLEAQAGAGLVEWDEQKIRLRPAAVLISNQVMADFVPAADAG